MSAKADYAYASNFAEPGRSSASGVVEQGPVSLADLNDHVPASQESLPSEQPGQASGAPMQPQEVLRSALGWLCASWAVCPKQQH